MVKLIARQLGEWGLFWAFFLPSDWRWNGWVDWTGGIGGGKGWLAFPQR